MMLHWALWKNFWSETSGQDTVEYTLLLAFVVLASAALFTQAGDSIAGIWTGTEANLVAANSRIQ